MVVYRNGLYGGCHVGDCILTNIMTLDSLNDDCIGYLTQTTNFDWSSFTPSPKFVRRLGCSRASFFCRLRLFWFVSYGLL